MSPYFGQNIGTKLKIKTVLSEFVKNPKIRKIIDRFINNILIIIIFRPIYKSPVEQKTVISPKKQVWEIIAF